MPTEDGKRFNWYHRHWHDWHQVERSVRAVAVEHARYLGYEVGDASTWTPRIPPPGNLEAEGPVVRVELHVFRRTGKHRPRPEYEVLYVDVERRSGGKFRPKTAAV